MRGVRKVWTPHGSVNRLTGMTDATSTEGLGGALQDEDLGDPVEDPDGEDETVSTTFNPEDPESFNG